MLASAGLLLLLVPALLVVFQMRSALGAWRGTAIGAGSVLLLGSAWGALEWTHRHEPPPPDDLTTLAPVQSQTCFKCHESHHASWQATYHRTMTREATPENVKGDFDNAVFSYMGVTSRMTRWKDRFFVDTVKPEWEMELTRQGIPLDKAGEAPREVYSIDRLVGSHWFQQMLHRDEHGRYLRFPLLYHIVEKRWTHINGAFLTPERPGFFGAAAVWNESCVFCHNTRAVKNPVPVPGQPQRGYRTEVGELGISCEACHGAGERHVLAHQNPARRLALAASGEADPTIINPRRLSVARSDDICARCHGGPIPRVSAWNLATQADPFLAGQELTRSWIVYWSEAEMIEKARKQNIATYTGDGREPLDCRFWGDGTPLTTALEYQGMALSACYQGGHGKMSCLTCHAMHDGDPNHQVKEGMRTNAACYGCHDDYRSRLVEHTHHATDSSGSLCLNCHMPHQVYSLLTTHRTHRISIPRVRDSVGTGKPHACNLCHLDKSLGWTSDQLSKWYGTKPEPLSVDDRTIASSVLHLARSDARTRAVVAGAFSSPDAQQASGRDWLAPLLIRTLESERYAAVRYLAHRALRSLHGGAANDYNYLGSPAERAAQLRGMQRMIPHTTRLQKSRYPHVPVSTTGLFDVEAFTRLQATRKDPDVEVNE